MKRLGLVFVVLAVLVGVGLYSYFTTDGPAPTLSLDKQSLKATDVLDTIVPFQVLHLEMPNLVPLPPYQVDIFDLLRIEVTGTLPDKPIDDLYLVNEDGCVDFGPDYGKVPVSWKNVDEATAAITKHLGELLDDPTVSVALARTPTVPSVAGKYVVAADGTITLSSYGSVRVLGMTAEQAKSAVEQHLSKFFEPPKVKVEMLPVTRLRTADASNPDVG